MQKTSHSLLQAVIQSYSKISDNNLDCLSILSSMKHYLPQPRQLPLKSACASLHFNQTTWSLHPSHSTWHFNYFFYTLSILIIFVNSCKVCVFYFCIFTNKLDLFKSTCSILKHLFGFRHLRFMYTIVRTQTFTLTQTHLVVKVLICI